MMMGKGGNRYNHPFTAEQWQELEQQALIYKYMVSGVPVPPELIASIRRSLLHSSSSSSSSSSSNLYPYQPILGSVGVWESGLQYNNQLYQLDGGCGGRKIDLEPGRCRRTDGKKWRCAKEAYPDSKYCERHMHRGRHRSRKPVELPSSSSPLTTVTTLSKPMSSSSSSSPYDNYQNTLCSTLHPHGSSSRHAGLSSTTTTTIRNDFMDSSSYSRQDLKDYRYLQGMKEAEENQRSAAYFQLNDPSSTTQKMASSSSSHPHDYSHFNFQNLTNRLKQQQKQEDQEEKERDQEGQQQQHCFVLGTDMIKSSSEYKETTYQMTNKKPFHHFFSPPESTPTDPAAWVDVDPSLSTQDFFQSKPRPYW